MTAEIFVIGLSETDTVTCTKDGKVKQGKWVEKEVTIYNENLIPAMTSNTEPKGIASASSVDTDGNTKVERSAWKAFSRVFTGHNDQWSSTYGATLPQWIQYKFDSPTNISGMKLCNIADGNYSTNSVGYVSISDDGENFTKIQEFSVPVTTVDSPSEVQFGKSYTAQYVRVYLTSYNDTYSSGTCRIALLQFMGYEKSVQHGWLFDKLNSYGTYTITVTNGTDTATQDVLVDMATQYSIEMRYKLYLYNLGDECESVTGGWDSRSDFTDVNDSKFVLKPYSATKSKTSITLSAESDSYRNESFLFAPKNKVNLDKYDKLNINVVASKVFNTTNSSILIQLCTGTDLSSSIEQTTIITAGQTYSGVVTVDISNFDYEIYLLIHTMFGGYTGNGSITFDKVWLE